jgi:hypothetical protein
LTDPTAIGFTADQLGSTPGLNYIVGRVKEFELVIELPIPSLVAHGLTDWPAPAFVQWRSINKFSAVRNYADYIRRQSKGS